MMVNTILLIVFLWDLSSVSGHGRLIEPPSRASAWRYGFDTPKNYNDNQLFCGGASIQNDQNNGKCGICGDRYDGVRYHEAGGEYATGTIVRYFTQGDVMDVTVDLTANHKGFFEFSICPNNDVNKAATDDCFFLLSSTDGQYQFNITTSMGSKKLSYQLQLPSNLICSQCILRWHYKAGNSWNCAHGNCGIGIGAQETFRGCADITINPLTVGSSVPPLTEGSTSTIQISSTNKKTSFTTSETPTSTTTTNKDKDEHRCKPVGVWRAVDGMERWCRLNCFHVPSYCPETHCSCS